MGRNLPFLNYSLADFWCSEVFMCKVHIIWNVITVGIACDVISFSLVSSSNFTMMCKTLKKHQNNILRSVRYVVVSHIFICVHTEALSDVSFQRKQQTQTTHNKCVNVWCDWVGIFHTFFIWYSSENRFFSVFFRVFCAPFTFPM